MATPVKFTREIRLDSSIERQGEAFIDFIVRARDGAVSLRVRASGPGDRDAEGWTLNSHMKRRVADWWLESGQCDVLEQGFCFGNTGYKAAGDAWAAFLSSSDEGWKFLEDTYNEWRKPDEPS